MVDPVRRLRDGRDRPPLRAHPAARRGAPRAASPTRSPWASTTPSPPSAPTAASTPSASSPACGRRWAASSCARAGSSAPRRGSRRPCELEESHRRSRRPGALDRGALRAARRDAAATATRWRVLGDSVALNLEKGSPIGLAFNRRALDALAARMGDAHGERRRSPRSSSGSRRRRRRSAGWRSPGRGTPSVSSGPATRGLRREEDT